MTWKYRSADAQAFSSLKATWTCPLRKEKKRKDELDVSVLAAGEVRLAYSRSCTAEATFKAAVPAAVKALQRGCPSSMTRYETSDESLTLELWRLASGESVLELSAKGDDSIERVSAFREQVVAKLLAAGATPLDRSKSEIGTQCKAQPA